MSGVTDTISFDISGVGHAEIASQTISTTSCSSCASSHSPHTSDPISQLTRKRTNQKMALPNFLSHYLRLIIEMWNNLLYFSSRTEDASWLSGLNSHDIVFPFAKVRIKPGGVFLFRKSSLQIKWDYFRVKEGSGGKQRKSCRIYLMEKAYYSGGIIEDSSADLHQLKTGSILCLCSTASPHKLWAGWSRLHSVLSFQPTRAASCLSPWEGEWLTCHDVDSGIPQSHRWRWDRQLSPHTRTCDE